MFISEAFMNADGNLTLEVRVVRGVRALFAVFLADQCCVHFRRNGTKFCYVDPPTWAWNMGITWRFSVGRLISAVGNRSGRIVDGCPVVVSRDIDDAEAISYGWTVEQIGESRESVTDLDDWCCVD